MLDVYSFLRMRVMTLGYRPWPRVTRKNFIWGSVYWTGKWSDQHTHLWFYTQSQKNSNIFKVAFLLEKSVYQWIWGYTLFRKQICRFLMTPGHMTLTLGPRKNPQRKVAFLLGLSVHGSPMAQSRNESVYECIILDNICIMRTIFLIIILYLWLDEMSFSIFIILWNGEKHSILEVLL